MRVYICGPMAGKPNLNREAFEAAAEAIRARGDEPVLPHDLEPYSHEGECNPVYGTKGSHAHDGGCYLRGDIAVMVTCDYIYRLVGWTASKGATVETDIAKLLMIPIEDEKVAIHVHRCDRDEQHRDMSPCHCTCGATFALEGGPREWVEAKAVSSQP